MLRQDAFVNQGFLWMSLTVYLRLGRIMTTLVMRNTFVPAVIFSLSILSTHNCLAATDSIHQASDDYSATFWDWLDDEGFQSPSRVMLSDFQNQTLMIFNDAKQSATLSIQQGLLELQDTALVDSINTTISPVLAEVKTKELKASLPSAIWLFLSGILSVLGFKKRESNKL